MIVFDLRCPQAHVFEVWFGSSADFESQQARGLVECPYCGSTEIQKAVMAPAVSPKGNRVVTPAEQLQRQQAEMAEIARIKAEVEANCDYVGTRFVEEARARHAQQTQAQSDGDGDGDTPRGIYGEASLADTLELLEDGIDVMPLPFRPKQSADA